MITEGILNINKPQNMTSHDVVAIARRALGIKKIGHTGTLDPMARGVLPICIGKSTRIIEYLDMDIKKYRCTLLLGTETDTQDVWGKIISQKDTSEITEEKVIDAFSGFHGVICQKPPMYSALKVNGKKLYEYAREGKAVDVKTRNIYIEELTIEQLNLEGDEKTVTFSVSCTKGTYIRTICQDVGEILGCGAALKSLERRASGIFSIDEALDLEVLREGGQEVACRYLYETSAPLTAFGKVLTDQISALRFASGWHLALSDCRIIKRPLYEEKDFHLPIRDEFKRAYNVFGNIDGRETFMGVAFYSETYKKLVADKVFYAR